MDSDQDQKPFTSPVLVGTIPSNSAANFRYNAKSRNLVFSAYVYPDGNLTTVKEQDKEWGERGNSAYVYDTTYVRHWDAWQGNKGQQLFSIRLHQGKGGVWQISDNGFNSPLKGTKHVCVHPCSYAILSVYMILIVYPGRAFRRN